MNQVVKFPDMRPPNPLPPIPPIPTPADYRRNAPIFTNSDAGESAQRYRRKRLWMWFGVAVALHAALLLTLWLTPPLRLKWNPSPDAWVLVTSLSKPVPLEKDGSDAQKTAPDPATAIPSKNVSKPTAKPAAKPIAKPAAKPGSRDSSPPTLPGN
jgi:hypothetical protein